MNRILLKNVADSPEKLRLILLLLYVFSLPYSIFYSSVIFLTFCATLLIDLNKEKFRQIPSQVWFFQIVYFLGLLGYLYSSHKPEAGFLLERQLTILLFPLILPLAIRIDEEKLQLALATLTLTSIIAICYLFLSMIHTILVTIQLPFIETAFSGAFFNHQFSKPLDIHAGYLSLYVSLSVFYIVTELNKTSVLLFKVLLILAFIILFMGLFFLASRNDIIATLFILLFIYPLFKAKHKLRYILISGLTLLLGFFVITRVPYLKDRFFKELITDIKPLQDGSNAGYNIAEPRIERWLGAVALIKKSPLIGYGTGDEIAMLKTEYIRRQLYISYVDNFNAHNQYLSYLLKNGILGISIFLLAFSYYLNLAMRSKKFLYLAFLLLLMIGFYTENILDANKGILLFALFNTLFGYTILSEERLKQKME